MNTLTSRWTGMPTGVRTLQRAAAVSFVSVAAALTFGGPALAVDAVIPLKADHTNVKAADFSETDCSDEGQLPQKPGLDGWHFVLPSGSPTSAFFVEVRLTFQDGTGATQTRTIPDDGTLGPPSAKHAIIYTPAGWTLVSGVADITGQQDGKPSEFNLSHTCPAGPAPSATPSATGSTGPSQGPSDSPSGTPSQGPSGTAAPSQGPSDTPPGSAAPSTSPAPNGELPVTGLAIGGMVLTGLGLVGAGAAMRVVRRRNPALEATEGETDSDGGADDKKTDV